MTSIQEKAAKIRLLILDVDGVLTSGVLYYADQSTEFKCFHIHDGLGIQLLQKSGIKVAIISGKHSLAVQRRSKELEISYCYLGHQDKLPPYQELKEKLNLQDNEIAYIGDDLPDLPLLKRAGLAITVQHAPSIMHQYVDIVLQKKPGKGAVREACEMLMAAQGTLNAAHEAYLSR
jgi:3-deoxy-D-manno-octulosonate 8-phosphate phosphatase (KDO 8-P phosphatase)